MADWRQIQARIRKAKASSDAPAQLAELYEGTRDAMVAFELASLQEKAGENAEAAQWYGVAAERFRRAQWRTKAEEALGRLGAAIPVYVPEHTPELQPLEPQQEGPQEQEKQGESSLQSERPPEGATLSASPQDPDKSHAGQKRRRRGRRGGRSGGDRKRGPSPIRIPPSRSVSSVDELAATKSQVPQTFRSPRERSKPSQGPSPVRESPHQPSIAPGGHAGRMRTGEPALASRIAHLESQLRRLLVCPSTPLEDAEQAPAGPGVLLLSDSDQHTHYYIETCQTLRIGIGNLVRGGRGGKESSRLRARMAEDLGIAESRISKYLKDHCAVRWLQLDEGMSELAHFAIAVLRPVVNE